MLALVQVKSAQHFSDTQKETVTFKVTVSFFYSSERGAHRVLRTGSNTTPSMAAHNKRKGCTESQVFSVGMKWRSRFLRLISTRLSGKIT